MIIVIEDELTTYYCKYFSAKISLEDDNEATIRSKLRKKELEHEANMQDKQYNYQLQKIKIKREKSIFLIFHI